MHYIHESTFARIFVFLERTLQQEIHIYTNFHNLYTLFLPFLSSFENNFILIGHCKQFEQKGLYGRGSSSSWTSEQKQSLTYRKSTQQRSALKVRWKRGTRQLRKTQAA